MNSKGAGYWTEVGKATMLVARDSRVVVRSVKRMLLV